MLRHPKFPFWFAITLTVVICAHTAFFKWTPPYDVVTGAAQNIVQGINPYAPDPQLDFFKYSPLAGLLMLPFSVLPGYLGHFSVALVAESFVHLGLCALGPSSRLPAGRFHFYAMDRLLLRLVRCRPSYTGRPMERRHIRLDASRGGSVRRRQVYELGFSSFPWARISNSFLLRWGSVF